MTTLNGLTRPWDAFIQTICAKKEKLNFDSVWEECVQEEAIVANREALLSRDEDQALTTHTKGGRKRSYFQKETHQHKESHPQNKFIHEESHPPRRFHKGQRREKISHPINVTIVTRWDILIRIVQLDEKNTRREIRGTMPIQLKMKSHPKR
jgi:hypothetical protein